MVGPYFFRRPGIGLAAIGHADVRDVIPEILERFDDHSELGIPSFLFGDEEPSLVPHSVLPAHP